MNKIYYWIIGCVAACCLACTENNSDDVYVSGLDLDYFVVSPDYDNAVDSLRYAIFEKYGIPVYYDDTIGVYDRGEVDRFGNTWLFYRIIRPGYEISTYGSVEWREVEDVESLAPLLDVMLHGTFDYCPKKILPRSIYLVDWIRANNALKTYYRTMEAGLLNVNDRELTEAGGCLIAAEISGSGLQFFYNDALQEFFNASKKLTGGFGDIYGQKLDKVDIYEEGDVPEEFGFLRFSETNEGDECMVSSDEDVVDFLELMFGNTREEVYADYAEWPVILEKYEIIVKIWDKVLAAEVE